LVGDSESHLGPRDDRNDDYGWLWRLGCNTQINRLSAPELPQLCEAIRDAGVRAWQIQLAVPMGSAADNEQWLLQPAELVDVYEVIARVVRRSWTD